ncbi:DUF2924 domain-containing protein [Magnetococcus sp. PR-3]|uniref:DUF2924 domain-containing protein n=1 Tax=Magnetococcus sp. PR-3 TaxID=3120355 RepID=UPI002FCDE807
MTQNIMKRLAELPEMSTQKLKTLWRELFNKEPPGYDRRFMIKRLAYRIQELAYGGHSEETKARLQQLANDDVLQARVHINQRSDGYPLPGTKLIREWKGTEHSVTVQEGGFEYQGRPFGSLSAVAREITGTRWNGWTFFGIKRPGKVKQ